MIATHFVPPLKCIHVWLPTTTCLRYAGANWNSKSSGSESATSLSLALGLREPTRCTGLMLLCDVADQSRGQLNG
jgi:hypothetical protein